MASLAKLGRIWSTDLPNTVLKLLNSEVTSGITIQMQQLHTESSPFQGSNASFHLLNISHRLVSKENLLISPFFEHLSASNANIIPFILPGRRIVCKKEYVLPNLLHQVPLRLSLPTVLNQEKVDPLYHSWKIEEPTSQPIVEKHAVRMLIIRRKKMKKHKLKKLRRKMKIVWARLRLKREIKKEKAFQAELMAQIKEAEAFSAEEYVKGILKTIKEAPQPETPEERKERILDLMRKHRSHVNFIKPKFD